MASTALLVALSIVAATSTVQQTSDQRPATAPPGTADTLYCMRIELIIGSRIQQVRCWTRAEWAVQEVDVDHDWPEDGVRVIG